MASMSELDISIDIHSAKLLDWLISRKHVKPNWSESIGDIRSKINEAVNDMPKNTDISCLLSGAYIHYFHCKDIAKVLEDTKDGSKNVFGGYSSKRMNDWLDIIRMYEKNNLYIAESARLLHNNVYFDVPSLRKRIQKLEQSQQDIEKRESELQKNHSTLKADFRAECDVLGIQGINIKEELQAIVPELLNIYTGVEEAAPSILPAIDIYRRYKAHQNVNELGLCVVRHVIEHGNTTVFEYLYQKAPQSIVPDKLAYEVEQNCAGDDEIDFGDSEDKIDFGDNIDYGVSVKLHSIQNCKQVPQSDIDIATGFEALLVLDEPVHRDLFIGDLLELQMFLKVLLSEATHPKNGKTGVMNLDIEVESEDLLSKMLLQVSTILELIDGASARKLHNIKHIPNYLEQLAVHLKNKNDAIKRNEANLEHCTFEIKQCYQDHKTANNSLRIIINKTKQLQIQIEESISKLYNNRPVNLIINI